MTTIIKYFSVLFLITVSFISCSEPEEIISPMHYSRVPRPQNLTASVDTTDFGTKRVSLSWSIPSTQNLKSFELYRSKNNSSFSSRVITEGFNFVDTNFVSTDVSASYYLQPNGQDRFVGQTSDILRVNLVQ